VITVVVSFALAAGLALIAITTMLVGGQPAPYLRGWGIGRLLAFFLAAGCVSSALIGLGLSILPEGRSASAFLGSALSAGLYLL
jgi:hypothetical protein